MEEDSIDSQYDFLPSTVEHRPLHTPEKVELKKYFELSGATEHEGYLPSVYATSQALADLEAWQWGMRLWGRECTVRCAASAVYLLSEIWDQSLGGNQGDEVLKEVAYEKIKSPHECASKAIYWANTPSEEKALRIMEKIQPLPEDWFKSPKHEDLQSKVFFWGALSGWKLLEAILAKRDEAAQGVALSMSAAARALMLMGKTEEEAIQATRSRVILDLRTWMGYKW
jgi:hypothetical protein